LEQLPSSLLAISPTENKTGKPGSRQKDIMSRALPHMLFNAFCLLLPHDQKCFLYYEIPVNLPYTTPYHTTKICVSVGNLFQDFLCLFERGNITPENDIQHGWILKYNGLVFIVLKIPYCASDFSQSACKARFRFLSKNFALHQQQGNLRRLNVFDINGVERATDFRHQTQNL